MRLEAILAGLSICLSLPACGPSEDPETRRLREERERILQGIAKDQVNELARLAELEKVTSAAFERDKGKPTPAGAQACRAAISEILSQSPGIVSARQLGESNYLVSYTRDDGEKWSYVCQATPDRIRWATKEGDHPGPWRIAENVRYKSDGQTLALTIDKFGEGDETFSFDVKSLAKKKDAQTH